MPLFCFLMARLRCRWDDVDLDVDVDAPHFFFLTKIIQVYKSVENLFTNKIHTNKHEHWINKGYKIQIRIKNRIYSIMLTFSIEFVAFFKKEYKMRLLLLLFKYSSRKFSIFYLFLRWNDSKLFLEQHETWTWTITIERLPSN